MANLKVLTREEAGAETQQVFDTLKSKVGMVPNLYAATGNSQAALTAMLGLGETLGKGSFSGKEIEAIALAVGQANDCGYCLSAHTALAKMNGFTEEETISLRNADIQDEKLFALTQLAREITISKGKPAQASIDAFFAAGYDQAALAELIGFVALNTFTNYVNHIAATPIDFPLAKGVSEEPVLA